MNTKIYCDIADLNFIKKFSKKKIVKGFTTNPSLMRKAGAKDYKSYCKKIIKVSKKKPVSFEVFGDDYLSMKEQALKVGTEFHHDIVKSVKFDDKPFLAETDSGIIFDSKTIIIATGAQARWLNLESENKFKGFGISACATCDGFFFKDQNIIVVGGGNSAVEEALYLTNFASKVTLVHRRDTLRAEKILQERLLNHPKIEVVWNHTVDEFIGTEEPLSLNKIKLKNTKDNNEKIIDATGAFIAIGHDPSTSLFKDKIKMDNDNYIVTKSDSTETNIKGVFAAGDVKDKVFRQAVTAAGMGCMAALEAEKFIAENY